MKKITWIIIAFAITFSSFGQTSENKKLIELGKAYKDFMFMNNPPKEFIKTVQTNVPENLKVTTNFIAQTITTDNDLLTKPYLTLPNDESLKFINIIICISENLREENSLDNDVLIDSLQKVVIPKNELVDNYYSTLFAAVGNKNKPFNFSKVDFKLNEYNLTNETEKGIFFLQCMSSCGMEIWGYMNIVKPANTKKAFENIKKYPKFNGLKYYQYNDFSFQDFEMVIVTDKGKQSYKSYYLDKYYNVLIYHLICLNKEGAKEDEINNLLLGSILKERNLYKYSNSKEILESLFKEQKVD